MIKKFEQYNESLRDQMKPKSKEDIKSNMDKFLLRLKDMKDNPKNYENEDFIDTYINILIQTIDTGELISILINEGVIDEVELLYYVMSPGLAFSENYFNRNQNKILDKIYDIIVKNKEKLLEIEL